MKTLISGMSMKTCWNVCCFLLITASLSAHPLREHILFDDDWYFAFGNASSPEKDFGCGTEYFNYLTKAASIHNTGPYSDKFDASGWKHGPACATIFAERDPAILPLNMDMLDNFA